ncbi:MAG: outer membrane protein assembly factor BamB [Gammaproteobacteria bacterium]|nr:outer membrane protein assembly factor BamB [Gammaproteobacteria bacterium]
MTRLIHIITWICFFVLLTGCSSKDNSDPPALLTKLENPIPLKVLWETDTDAAANNASFNLRPLLVDNQILTVDIVGNIVSLDATSGRKNWDYETQLSAITGLAGNLKVIVVSSSDGDLVAYDRQEQGLESRWSIRLSGEIRSIPAIDGDQIFVRTTAGKLSTISLIDGSVQWTVSRRIPALSLTGNSSPIIDEDRIIVGFDDGKLAAFDRNNGQTIWERVISHASGRTEIQRLVDIDGDFLLKDGIIYVSTYQGQLSALQSIDGNVLWTRKFSSYQSIVADDDALYISGDMSHLWSIDRRTGSAFWKQEKLHARKITAPQMIDSKVVVADLEGYVHWLNKTDGTLLGRVQVSDSRVIAQPTRWQNSIIVYDSNGHLSSVSTQ